MSVVVLVLPCGVVRLTAGDVGRDGTRKNKRRRRQIGVRYPGTYRYVSGTILSPGELLVLGQDLSLGLRGDED